MNLDHVASGLLITGPRGSGKSTLGETFFHDWRSRWQFVFDVDLQWSRRKHWTPQRTFADCAASLARTGLCVYDPPSPIADSFARFCEFVLKISRRLNRPKLLVCEEFQDCVSSRGQRVPAAFQEIVDRGRREEIDLLCLSQSPNRIHCDVREAFTAIAAFQFCDAAPLDWLSGYGFDRSQVLTLPKFAYL